LYGIPLVIVVFGLQIYTAILLGRSWIIATALDPQISRKNRYFHRQTRIKSRIKLELKYICLYKFQNVS